MAIQIQLRRDSAADWTSANPTLAQGEVGYETDTNTFKIGDGVTAWSGLSYFSGGGGSGTVTSGTQYRLAYYAATGTTVSENAAITGAKALKSDANGVPTHFDTTTEPSLAELAHVKGVTGAIQTQIDNTNELNELGFVFSSFNYTQK